MPPNGRTLAPFGRRSLAVLDNRASGSYRVFTVADPSGPVPEPGQFYMLVAAARWDADGERPYLPRAFSVATAADGRLAFLVEAVGPGTERLASLGAGEQLWVTGPLGKPFSPPERLGCSSAVLVGGGIGVAPLAIWQRRLAAQAVKTAVVLGFRDRDHAGGLDLFDCDLELASDDGHIGHRGLVTDLLEPFLAEGPQPAVFACGPPAMLEAVRALCAEHRVACELAMESGMACGFGACMGCVVPTREGYIRLCVDGPVLNALDLETALVPGAGH